MCVAAVVEKQQSIVDRSDSMLWIGCAIPIGTMDPLVLRQSKIDDRLQEKDDQRNESIIFLNLSEINKGQKEKNCCT